MDEVSDRESSVVSLELPLFVKKTMRNAFAKLATPGFLLSVALVGCGVFSNPAVEAVKKGDAAVEKGDLDLAIAEFSDAIRLDPKNALAYSGRGNAYKRKAALDNDKGEMGQGHRRPFGSNSA